MSLLVVDVVPTTNNLDTPHREFRQLAGTELYRIRCIRSRDMSPSEPALDFVNHRWPNVVILGNRRIRSTISADGLDLFGVQLCAPLPLAYSDATPTFSIHIADVVDRRPKKKMRRIYAVRNVALVQDVQADWNRTAERTPRKPVRQLRLALIVKAAVPVTISAHIPQPAPTFRDRHRSGEDQLGESDRWIASNHSSKSSTSAGRAPRMPISAK